MGTFHVIPKETKEQILGRIKNEGVSAAQAAKDAGISANTIYGWLSKTVNGQNNNGVENARLKRELSGAYELIGKLTAELSAFKKKTGNWRLAYGNKSCCDKKDKQNTSCKTLRHIKGNAILPA